MSEQGVEPAERNGRFSHERGLDDARVEGIDGDIAAGESVGEVIGEEQVGSLRGTEGLQSAELLLALCDILEKSNFFLRTVFRMRV